MCKDPGRNQFPRIPLGIESTHWLLSPAPAARCLELDFPSSDLFVSWRTLGTFHPLPYTHFFAVELTTPSFSFPLSPFFHVGSRTAKLWEIATTTRLSIGRRLAPPWPRDRTAFATIFNHSLLSFTELRNHTPFQLRRHWQCYDPRDRVASFPFPFFFLRSLFFPDLSRVGYPAQLPTPGQIWLEAHGATWLGILHVVS